MPAGTAAAEEEAVVVVVAVLGINELPLPLLVVVATISGPTVLAGRAEE